ncbi:MAG: hypothetical protein J7M25_16050 [Deltaproteobacteria bacterium]|nr:hypothetical protein [Deltaproteobacteria bacterium]
MERHHGMGRLLCGVRSWFRASLAVALAAGLSLSAGPLLAAPESGTKTTGSGVSGSGAQSAAAGQSTEDKAAQDGAYEPQGPTSLSGGIGFTYGLTDDSVGGFLFALSYGYRLTDWMWLDSQANFSFGADCKIVRRNGTVYRTDCGSVHGFGIQLLAGLQWKFYGVWKIPVVPFVRADLGVNFVLSNGPYDGVAVVARGSGGARYHFTKWFSVGGELGATVGPVFRNDLPTNFFASVDILAEAEFSF